MLTDFGRQEERELRKTFIFHIVQFVIILVPHSVCVWKKNKDRRKKRKQSHAMQTTSHVWLSQAWWEGVLGMASTGIWFMLMLVLSVLQAWKSEAWLFRGNLTLRSDSHLPRELPPALAGQTEPSPSSWEVWSPSTSYSRAGNGQSLEKQKRLTWS